MRTTASMAWILLLGLVLALGCSSDKNDGGDGGPADGGDAGLPPECDSDEDCDGEFCVGGQCV